MPVESVRQRRRIETAEGGAIAISTSSYHHGELLFIRLLFLKIVRKNNITHIFFFFFNFSNEMILGVVEDTSRGWLLLEVGSWRNEEDWLMAEV